MVVCSSIVSMCDRRSFSHMPGEDMSNSMALLMHETQRNGRKPQVPWKRWEYMFMLGDSTLEVHAMPNFPTSKRNAPIGYRGTCIGRERKGRMTF